MVFSQAWFEQHQSRLLRLLALPLLGRLFRRALAIRPHDIGYHKPIVELTPHSYTVVNDDGTYTTDFRTHAKYGKRLYYAGLPLWKALHAWDMAIANPLVPALNAGFDTLPFYPDPGTPGTTSGDWGVGRNGVTESWATITAGAGTVTSNSPTDHWVYTSYNAASQFTQHYVGVWTFNTSSLRGSAVLTSVVFSAWPSSPYNTGAVPTQALHVVGVTPTSYVQGTVSDYQNRGRTSFGSITAGAYTTLWNGGTVLGYASVSLNASGLAYVARTGVSAFCTTHDWDLTGSNPVTELGAGPLDFNIQAETADQTGLTNDPKLEVTFSRAVEFPFLHLSVGNGMSIASQWRN